RRARRWPRRRRWQRQGRRCRAGRPRVPTRDAPRAAGRARRPWLRQWRWRTAGLPSSAVSRRPEPGFAHALGIPPGAMLATARAQVVERANEERRPGAAVQCCAVVGSGVLHILQPLALLGKPLTQRRDLGVGAHAITVL